MNERSPPRLFAIAGRERALWTLAVLTLLCGAAMLPATAAWLGPVRRGEAG